MKRRTSGSTHISCHHMTIKERTTAIFSSIEYHKMSSSNYLFNYRKEFAQELFIEAGRENADCFTNANNFPLSFEGGFE